MKRLVIGRSVHSLFALFTLTTVVGASALDPILLWSREAPGEKGDIGEEKDMTKPTDRPVAGKGVIRLGNVSKPAITVYRPPNEKATGAAVVVCPGGGYNILAWEKDQGDKIAPELTVSSNTPPTFLVQTQDDSVRPESSLFYY